jgi:hypothetical protein
MIIFMEYRTKGISKRQMVLNSLNPNFRGNTVRRFNVDSNAIGTEDLNEVARQAAIDIPGEDWELHKVFTIEPKQEFFIEYKELTC